MAIKVVKFIEVNPLQRAKHYRVDTDDLTSPSDGSVEWSNITGKPSTFPPSAHSHSADYLTKSDLDSAIASLREEIHALGCEIEQQVAFTREM